MNTQERDQLNQFLKQLVDFKLTQKDTDAEALIRDAMSRQPDATYLLVQRCLLLEHAVNAAQTKINDLQNQLQQRSTPSSAGSFLGNDPWAQSAASSNPVPGAGNYQIPQANNTPFNRAAPQAVGSGFGSSFLGNVATTAAGVVAGSFLFQGIENLMGHHQSGWGQQAFGEQVTEETIVNNYYGNSDQLANNNDDNSYLADNSGDDYFDGIDDSDTDWT